MRSSKLPATHPRASPQGNQLTPAADTDKQQVPVQESSSSCVPGSNSPPAAGARLNRSSSDKPRGSSAAAGAVRRAAVAFSTLRLDENRRRQRFQRTPTPYWADTVNDRQAEEEDVEGEQVDRPADVKKEDLESRSVHSGKPEDTESPILSEAGVR